jgi:hypothetical protein
MRGAKFWEKALQSDHLVPQDLRELIATKVREDDFIEYKLGKWLGKGSGAGEPREPAARLRKWIAGFANAEGGALVVGIGDPDKTPAYQVDGCPMLSPSRSDWARRMLTDFVADLPTPVRTHEVELNGHTVLIVAVPRAVRLIACRESSQDVYYLRNGEQTLTMSLSLVADLALGRRQRPVFDFDVRFAPRAANDGSDIVQLDAWVRNNGLTQIESHVYGSVSYGRDGAKVPRGLRRYIQIIPTAVPLRLVETSTSRSANDRIPPFGEAHHGTTLPVPRLPDGLPLLVKAVVFVAADGDLPRFCQLQFVTHSYYVKGMRAVAIEAGGRGVVSVEQVIDSNELARLCG